MYTKHWEYKWIQMSAKSWGKRDEAFLKEIPRNNTAKKLNVLWGQ